ncbi:MAG: hypothetical protein FJ087_12895 [Deltaproteobacteria bacterium]|nr:hypothetical protein [Deltaproteobacteria bacterium]
MARESLRQIAFYGKGGIGKSTVVANVTAALNAAGHRVLQVGCDPKHDSSRPFWDGSRPRTVIELLREYDGRNPPPATYVKKAASGVEYIEVGGPEPGVGCAGRGILKMFEMVEEARVLDAGYDAVLYDVLGDVVCGGFAAPLRAGYAREVFVVLSGEFMAIYAANNICKGIANYAERRQVRLGGLVLNRRNVPAEVEVVTAFADAIGSRVIHAVPRDSVVQSAERRRRTVVDSFPDSPQATVYKELASRILEAGHLAIPKPLSDEALEDLYYRVCDAAEAAARPEPAVPAKPARGRARQPAGGGPG